MDPRPKMIQLASELQDILMPYDVADPVIALQCPLGVSAAFHQLAILCLLVSTDCAQRALRLLHLSKLFAFFSYNDFGLWFGDARWGTNLNMVSSDARALVEHRVFSPVQSEDRWRIGLVSYCNYDDNVTRLTHLSRSNKQAYASLHSHELFHFEQPFVTQAHPWMNKLLAIERKLQDFEWIFWVDCDLFFVNPNLSVHTLVAEAVRQNPDVSLIITEDGMMLNSGSFLLRNSHWGVDFLAQTMDLLSAPMPYSFQHMAWHEQAPIIYLSLIPSVLQDIDDPGGPGYDHHVVLLPQRAMNAYPPELVERVAVISHEPFEDGDMVISFNGCASVLGGAYCEHLYGHYHRLSMERLLR